jgi:heme exporter protein B
MSMLREAGAVLFKDLLIELRTREVLYSMGLFSVLTVMIFTFAFAVRDEALAEVAPGVPWVAITFAGTLGLARSFSREQEADCLTGLLVSPASRGSLFLGKAAANFLFILAMEALLVPLCALMFNLDFGAAPWTQLALFLLGTLGFVSVGTLLSTMLLNSRLRDLMLPLVFYPIVIPVVIAGVKGTAAVLAGETDVAVEWLGMLCAFDAIFVTISFWAFGWVVEE